MCNVIVNVNGLSEGREATSVYSLERWARARALDTSWSPRQRLVRIGNKVTRVHVMSTKTNASKNVFAESVAPATLGPMHVVRIKREVFWWWDRAFHDEDPTQADLETEIFSVPGLADFFSWSSYGIAHQTQTERGIVACARCTYARRPPPSIIWCRSLLC